MDLHQFYSKIQWKPDTSTFEAAYEFDAFEIPLVVSSASESDTAPLGRAADFLVHSFEQIDLIYSVICENLLELYNESWRDGPVLSEADFQERITLHSIHLDDEGPRLTFADDDLFAGHWIVVLCSDNFIPLKAQIEG